MRQNRSSAVMQQRIEPHDSLDDFPTPPWGTRALIEHGLKKRFLPVGTALEPCCNRGYMAKPLREHFAKVWATDIFDYGWAGMDARSDFLLTGSDAPFPIDWAFFNPPFTLAQEFIEKALGFVRVGCAALVRTSFLEGQERYRDLFRDGPPTMIFQFSERIILTKGIVRDPEQLYWDPDAIDKKTGGKGAWKKPSTATSYAWLVWVPGMERQPFDWIPPCRKQMERPGDYEVPA
jgi:hypothetical protein